MMIDSDQSYVISETIYLIGRTSSSLNSLGQLLREQGYEIQVIDPQKALEIIQSDLPDLIIFSNIEDTSFCKSLKTDHFLSNIPILAFPIDNSSIEIATIFQLGYQDYLSVPLQPEEAIARVENQMMIVRLDRQLRETSEQLKLSLEATQEAEFALSRLNKNVEQIRPVDIITQVASYQRFQEYLEQQWKQGCRERILWADSSQSSLSLILCALDNWLDYQQQHGLESAECYLKEVAQTIVRHIKRPSDLVARYKDDTFAILLPNTNNQGAVRVAHILYNAIKAIDQSIIISIGVTTEIPTAALPRQTIIRNASQAYLKASETGGDHIINHEE